jgi:hypothetical protein
MWDCENNVVILDIQYIFDAFLDPFPLGRVLALGTMAVAT